MDAHLVSILEHMQLVPHRELVHTRSAETGRYHLATVRLHAPDSREHVNLTLELCPLKRQLILRAPCCCAVGLRLDNMVRSLVDQSVRQHGMPGHGGEANGA